MTLDRIVTMDNHRVEMCVGSDMGRFPKVAMIAALASAVPAVAFAVPVPVTVPEPETLTLVATAIGGAIGAYAIRKWTRRK
jgi:hypothetical protein